MAPLSDGFSENFAALNRNKRSLSLDLKDPAAIATVRRLVADSEVLIENNRPGVMARLGLGYAALRELNARLVYCSISAYGQSGPRAQEGGFDLTVQAMSGVMHVTGEPGRPPVKCGVPLADFSAGLYAGFAILAALRLATSSGQRSHLDIPMLGATLGIAALQTSEYFGSGRDPVALGSAHPRNAPYRVFASSDGYFGYGGRQQRAVARGVRNHCAPGLAQRPALRHAHHPRRASGRATGLARADLQA